MLRPALRAESKSHERARPLHHLHGCKAGRELTKRESGNSVCRRVVAGIAAAIRASGER